jgi:hypothetical protein
MLAGPPAFRLHVEIGGPVFLCRPTPGIDTVAFKHKLSVRLALLKDLLLSFCARRELSHDL